MTSSFKGPTLCEFLLEAELQQYYSGFKNDLKVQNVPQLKFVGEDDLHQIGMTKPEMRRLRKFFQRYYPQNYLSKFRKMILTKKEENLKSRVFLPDGSKQSFRVPSKHIIHSEDIVINKELGTGEFGVVQQGVWTNEDGERIQVAIKCLSRDRVQSNPIEFLKEAAIMHTIDHEHIVRLYGVVLDTGAMMLVTELAPLRSLLECIKEPSLRLSFPILTICDFALQICDGMTYLESKRLIHRDLAARNILVFSKNNVKISDFGLSRALGVGKDYYQTNFNVNLKLPIAWCAPECINYLRFTSASDVWAYGVTLWEMLSYGFQPWAALTGNQILEAIDQPNFQRLEQPECCPKEYYSLMLKCWQHDPSNRPRFADLLTMLPDCKPEQVQTISDSPKDYPKSKRDQLLYQVGDVITVLDKRPQPDSMNVWKGATANGKTGLFNPGHTVTYLGANLPSVNSNFQRGDGKNVYSSKRRLHPEMISRPQGDVKHTGHVGLDGAYFGDITFLGDKHHQLPKQIVTPYKPHEDQDHMSLTRTSSDGSDRVPLLNRVQDTGKPGPAAESLWSDNDKDWPPLISEPINNRKVNSDHEYHEISDEEHNSADSPRFENSFDLGPSLMDEVFKSLGTNFVPPPSPSSLFAMPMTSTIITNGIEDEQRDESHNVKNELKEIAARVAGRGESRKKQATVKPISAADQKTLDSAIAMVNEFACRSMDSDMRSGESDSPSSPSKRKFSFMFPGKEGPKPERRNFAEEAASITDIQSSLSEEAKEAYNSLIEKPMTEQVSPTDSIEESNPLRMLRSGVAMRPRFRGNKHQLLTLDRSSSGDSTDMYGSFRLPGTNPQRSSRMSANGTMPARLDRSKLPPPPTSPKPRPQALVIANSNFNLSNAANEPPCTNGANTSDFEVRGFRHSGDFASKLSAWENQNMSSDFRAMSIASSKNSIREDHSPTDNPLPLPPRDRSKGMLINKQRHHRKHPLVIPTYGMDQVDGAGMASRYSNYPYANVPFNFPNDIPIGITDGKLFLTEEAVARIPPIKPPRAFNLDDSFESQIASELDALDDIPNPSNSPPPNSPPPSPPLSIFYKSGDHVSCEDLLEFACDRPNARRTQGPAWGVDSDEVRIMQKVIGKEKVLPEMCISALNQTEWDVHKAIKCLKLESLLRVQMLPTDGMNDALESCNWDVARASSFVLTQCRGGNDATEV